MASLAGALKEFGDWQAAEDAYTVVAHNSDEHYYLIYAFDALAHLAALRGDEETFETRAAQCDALGWETGAHSAKAEILYYRALSYEALGRRSEATAGLERAILFAEEHAFNLVLFRAEEALRSLSTEVREAPQQLPAAPPEVREGLRALREDLAGFEA
jgi:tetratricopeptide (TPR) repeat protein